MASPTRILAMPCLQDSPKGHDEEGHDEGGHDGENHDDEGLMPSGAILLGFRFSPRSNRIQGHYTASPHMS
jgi:hypothetical protein